ncbi:hypothetical protein HCDSEM_111 [Candidatus Hodgkinia cicadicola Dsem]|nr:hypothetical protein HCDSEM_111 [Candidatus Hodgkinia cicadicola Dsem]
MATGRARLKRTAKLAGCARALSACLEAVVVKRARGAHKRLIARALSKLKMKLASARLVVGG